MSKFLSGMEIIERTKHLNVSSKTIYGHIKKLKDACVGKYSFKKEDHARGRPSISYSPEFVIDLERYLSLIYETGLSEKKALEKLGRTVELFNIATENLAKELRARGFVVTLVMGRD